MNDQKPRQQIVEKIRDSSNILVTVSQSPSVDELSAALGLTLLLNKLDKHATAVFSGDIPPAIEFLEPGKTFENTVNSLRDFIIALDKEKADHLRYKVDGDVVKIFITPYRTTIDEKDLEFSQGDYNVELVLALGVTAQEQLDTALEAHGRIFHDATVATATVGDQGSKLGSIDWHDSSVSSLSEMIVGLADALKKDKTLLDEQVATALLTGIVATTDRFSNNLTSSKVMATAAQLMAAGANQQLIAIKLGGSQDSSLGSVNSDGSTSLSEGESSKVKKEDSTEKLPEASEETQEEPAKKPEAGQLEISHEKKGTLDEVAAQTAEEQLDASARKAREVLAQQMASDTPSNTSDQNAEDELANKLTTIAATPQASIPSAEDLQKDLTTAPNREIQPQVQDVSQPELEANEPSLGGTLNATTEEAAEEKRRLEGDDRNRTILSHGSYVGDQSPVYASPLNATVSSLSQQQPVASEPMMDIQPTAVAPMITPPASAGLTLAQLDQENRSPHEEARTAIDAAFAAQPEEQTSPPLAEVVAVPAPAPNPFGVATTLPPLPDFSTLPPLPQQAGIAVDQFTGLMPPSNQTVGPVQDPAQGMLQATDPAQFRIPGQ